MKGTTLAVLFLSSLVAGCARFDIDQGDLSGRCAAAMQQAFPGGDIKITGERSHADTAKDYDTIVTDVEGLRQAVPPNAPPSPLDARRVAAECRYENGILMQFAWTEGPLSNAATAQRPPSP
jgi:hypothetical protein